MPTQSNSGTNPAARSTGSATNDSVSAKDDLQASISGFAAGASLRILELAGITTCSEGHNQARHIMPALLTAHGWTGAALYLAQQGRKHGILLAKTRAASDQEIAAALMSAGFPPMEAHMIVANVEPA